MRSPNAPSEGLGRPRPLSARRPWFLYLVGGVCLVALSGCARYTFDGPPSGSFDPSLIEPVVPKAEPLSAYGNHSPYDVWGERYEVLPTARGYVERGVASWYGTAFHGRNTSSGEPYDMYQLTAAHKHLPLPSYVEVTHLETGESIIVRVNDRGPFKPGRIIDLSWAAAVRLGIDQAGTAPVEVRALTFDEPDPSIRRPAKLPVWVQAGAFSDKVNAEKLRDQLAAADIAPVAFEVPKSPKERVWRVRLGPFSDVEAAISGVAQLLEMGLEQTQYVYP